MEDTRFFVLRTDCQCWTGEGWSPDFADALTFHQQPDPFSQAEQLKNELRAEGHRCIVACTMSDHPKPKRKPIRR